MSAKTRFIYGAVTEAEQSQYARHGGKVITDREIQEHLAGHGLKGLESLVDELAAAENYHTVITANPMVLNFLHDAYAIENVYYIDRNRTLHLVFSEDEQTSLRFKLKVLGPGEAVCDTDMEHRFNPEGKVRPLKVAALPPTPRFVIVVRAGSVAAVLADRPLNYTVADTDTEGLPEDLVATLPEQIAAIVGKKTARRDVLTWAIVAPATVATLAAFPELPHVNGYVKDALGRRQHDRIHFFDLRTQTPWNLETQGIAEVQIDTNDTTRVYVRLHGMYCAGDPPTTAEERARDEELARGALLHGDRPLDGSLDSFIVQ